MFYALVRLLSSRSNVALQTHDNGYWLFTEESVEWFECNTPAIEQLPRPRSSGPESPKSLICLVDISYCAQTVAPGFSWRGSFVVAATMPGTAKFELRQKYSESLVFYMDVWEEAEFRDLAFVFQVQS